MDKFLGFLKKVSSKKIIFLLLSFFIIGITIFYAKPALAALPTEDICGQGITNKEGTAITSTKLVTFVTCRPAFYQIWKAMVGLVDIIVVIGFIIFALANVFHIKYDEYQAKKAIPGLIIGIVLANLSWPICLFLIGIVQNLTNLFITNPSTFFQNLANLYGWMWALAGASTIVGTALAFLGVGFAGLIVALILFLIPMLIVLAIGGILWVRGLTMVVLVSAAPLAFALNFFPVKIPYLSDLAGKWFQWFWKWLFIGPVMFFLFWLAFTINTAGRPTAPGTTSTITPVVQHTIVAMKSAATQACQDKKNATSASDWAKGSCLNKNIFNDNSNIAININNSSNQTGKNYCNVPVTWVEYDTNCNYVRDSDNLNLK